jgi:hypothetical protein
MVRPKQQTDRVLEGLIAGEPAWICVAMRADDGQRFDGSMQAHCNRADSRIRGKESLRIQMKWSAHIWPVQWSGNIAIHG